MTKGFLIRQQVLWLLFSMCRAHAATLPPNIIIVLTDDQRWDTVNRDTMPTVDRLARGGVRFTSAFTSAAVCQPSRASLLTGNDWHTHQVEQALDSIGVDADTIATRLHAAGYRTGIFGKYINDYDQLGPPHQTSWYIPPGWDIWNVLPSNQGNYFDYTLVTGPMTSVNYGHDVNDYSTAVLADRAKRFILDSISANRPYLAVVTPYAPHADAVPAPRDVGYWDGVAPWRPASYAEADISDKPMTMWFPIVDQATLDGIDQFRQNQLEALRAVDRLVRAVKQASRHGKRGKDTIIVFAADNGYLWYEHRLFGKFVPYEEAHRVPLIIRYPRKLASRVDPGLATLTDVTVTVLEWAGVSHAGMDGQSMATALTTQTPLLRDAVLLEGEPTTAPTHYRGVRTATWSYVEWYSGEEEVYALTADPLQLNNVAKLPAYAVQKALLRARMLAMLGE